MNIYSLFLTLLATTPFVYGEDEIVVEEEEEEIIVEEKGEGENEDKNEGEEEGEEEVANDDFWDTDDGVGEDCIPVNILMGNEKDYDCCVEFGIICEKGHITEM